MPNPFSRQVTAFFADTEDGDLAPFHEALKTQLQIHFVEDKHGRTNQWNELFAQLPDHPASHINLGADTLEFGRADKPDKSLEAVLKAFSPWRKGPYNFFGIKVDAEWRSDWKWQRISPHISNLSGRKVLDIGCGNGYHLFRMLGDGALLALGVDPTRLFLYQFHIAHHFAPHLPIYLLPLRSEHLPAFQYFDTVFSLGVLYHRRSPVEHLTELSGFLRPGGELVLETLIIEGGPQTILIPQGRYARMANVWFLPSPEALENMLSRAGFQNIRTVDINITSTEEQRTTPWMKFHSLADFLDPQDSSLTTEGLPAPKRAIVIANKPAW